MQLGSYRLLERLGTGGMGEVWKAEDTQLLRPVAVKVMLDHVASDAEARARFLREARMAARLSHPCITTIYEVGEQDSTMYIAMELVEGELLSSVIARGNVRVSEAVRVVRQTAEALACAHAQQIIHRDVKPDNIAVQPSSVKVLDFGIAKQFGPSSDKALTMAQMVLGTPSYMSPEQAHGQSLDARSDLFSLGVVLFEALTGSRPFDGATVTETMLKIVTCEVPPDPRSLVPHLQDDLAAIVRKAMRKRREERFQSAEEMASALRAILCEERASEQTIVLRRALVADEDPATRQFLRDNLAMKGVVCDEVANGSDAIQLLKKQTYSMAFIDLFLPRIDGWGVLDFIQRHATQTKNVFAVTSARDQRFSAVDRRIVAGVLHKPLDRENVEHVIAHLQ